MDLFDSGNSHEYGTDSELAAIDSAAFYLREQGIVDPEIAIILGSGLGRYAEKLQDPIIVKYTDIPGFAHSTAPGHKGAFYYGTREGKRILIMSGRFHYYEGYPMSVVVRPVRVMVRLGIKRLIITNASGGVNPSLAPGTLMVIRDHINMSGTNPLIAGNLDEFGERFPDMTDTYDRNLRLELLARSHMAGIDMEEGVYVMMSGPSFETPAEVNFLRVIGADAVGMSSVPEAITANHAGLEIIGISCIANAAAGVGNNPLSGQDVIDVSEQIAGDFAKVLDISLTI